VTSIFRDLVLGLVHGDRLLFEPGHLGRDRHLGGLHAIGQRQRIGRDHAGEHRGDQGQKNSDVINNRGERMLVSCLRDEQESTAGLAERTIAFSKILVEPGSADAPGYNARGDRDGSI